MQSSRISTLVLQNRAVAYIGVATFLFTIAQGITIFAYPLYGRELGLTVAQVGLTVSGFALARVFTNVPAAMLSNRIGRRWVLVGAGLLAATGYVLTASADALLPLMAARFIVGIGSGAFITVAIAATSDLSSPGNRALLMSIYQWTFIAGITLGPFVGGIIAEFWGLRLPFYVVGGVSVLSALWTLTMVPETRGTQVTTPTALETQGPHETLGGRARSWLREHRFMFGRDYALIMLIFIGAFFIRGGGLFNLFPIIASEDLALSEGWVGFMQTLPAIASLLVLIGVGWLSDILGRKLIIVPAMLLYVVCLIVLGYSAPFWVLPAAVIFAVGIFIFGIAQGAAGPVPIAYVSDVSPPEQQATAQGMARTIGDVALMSGGPVLGLISDSFGSAEALYGTAAAMGVMMLIFWIFARETAGRRLRGA